jgi:hypothetical protein
LVKQIGVHDGATDVTDVVLVAFGIVVGALAGSRGPCLALRGIVIVAPL